MKKLITILICFLLVGCNKTKTDILKFKEEYESINEKTGIIMNIDKDINLKYMDVEQTYEMIKEGSGIIYFGFPECPWCRNVIPVLFDVAKKNNITISYFNPRELRGTEDETFKKIIEELDEYLKTDANGKKTLYVPDIYFIKKGEIVGHHLSTVESQTNPKIALIEEQTKELKQIYTDLIYKIK